MFNVSRTLCLASLIVLPSFAAAQPNQQNRIPYERLAEEPTVQERILEERAIAEEAARESAADAALTANIDDSDAPPASAHANSPASSELVALAAREPERFLGKTLVLQDGPESVEVGPILALRKRVLDQEPYLIVDATNYFNLPTQYAVAVRDVDRIAGDRVLTPEAAGMHLRGLEYYAEDYAELESTAPEDVLAAQEEGEAAAEAAEDATETGVIPLKRF